MSTPEGLVVRDCIDYLKVRQIPYIRNNTGRRGGVSYGSEGSADILACLPGGRFLAVECKAGKGRLSTAQVEFRRDIENNSGLYVLAYSVDDLIAAMEAI